MSEDSDTSDTWTLPARGRAGMVGLIFTETSFFAIFVVAYLYYVGKSTSGPTPAAVLHTPILASIVLLSSSWTIVLAMRALRADATGRFARWWLVTFLLGGTFLVLTAREWARLIGHDGLTIATNLFGTTYYPLVGLHASHVIIGLVMLTLCCVFAWTGSLRQAHADRVEIVSWYWHFVDGVWVVVFTVVYVIGR